METNAQIDKLPTLKIPVPRSSYGIRKINQALGLSQVSIPGQPTLFDNINTAPSHAVKPPSQETYNTIPMMENPQYVEHLQYNPDQIIPMKEIRKYNYLDQIKEEISNSSQNKLEVQVLLERFETMREQMQIINGTYQGEELLIIFLSSQMLKKQNLQSIFPEMTSQDLAQREVGLLGSFLDHAGIPDLDLVIGNVIPPGRENEAEHRVWLEWKFNGKTYTIDPANYPVDITLLRDTDEEAYQEFMEIKGFPITDIADVHTAETPAVKSHLA